MKILLTGASGFIGGAFMRRFGSLDELDLFGIGRRQSPALPASVRYRSLDLSQPFDIDFNPDVVIHAAARASPWGSALEYRIQNVETTRQVIRFCERKGWPRLIYISSSSVFYRNEHQFGLHEKSPIGPEFVNAYAASKYAGELLLGDYPGEKTILRPRAVFGPGDTVLFPRILAAAKTGRLFRFVSDGLPAIGDVIYIDVLCDYILAAATRHTVQDSYNLTNAEPVEIETFLCGILRALDLPTPQRTVTVSAAMRGAYCVEWIYRTLRLFGEPPVTRFGVSVFAYSKTFLPWRMLADFGPASVPLSEGVERFVNWQKQQWLLKA